MKKLFLILFPAIFILSCKKNVEPDKEESGYLNNIKACLKDSLTAGNYANLDFARSVITKKDKEKRFFRVPLVGKRFSEEFILLYTDTVGKILEGSIFNFIKLKSLLMQSLHIMEQFKFVFLTERLRYSLKSEMVILLHYIQQEQLKDL